MDDKTTKESKEVMTLKVRMFLLLGLKGVVFQKGAWQRYIYFLTKVGNSLKDVYFIIFIISWGKKVFLRQKKNNPS